MILMIVKTIALKSLFSATETETKSIRKNKGKKGKIKRSLCVCVSDLKKGKPAKKSIFAILSQYIFWNRQFKKIQTGGNEVIYYQLEIINEIKQFLRKNIWNYNSELVNIDFDKHFFRCPKARIENRQRYKENISKNEFLMVLEMINMKWIISHQGVTRFTGENTRFI